MDKAKADWLSRCRANEQVAQQCFGLINDYHESGQRPDSGPAATKARMRMRKFRQELEALKAEFQRIEQRSPNKRQLQALRQAIDNQHTLLKRLDDAYEGQSRAGERRTELLGDAHDASPWIGGEENETTRQWPSRELTRQHQEILADQDRGLDALAASSRRQRDVALGISAEVDYHNTVIDAIGTGMAETDQRIASTNRNLFRLERKHAGTGGLWAIIFVLALLIVVALAIPKPF